MEEKIADSEKITPIPPVFVVSGSLKGAGEQLVHTILAQYQDIEVPVQSFHDVRDREQVEQVIAAAAAVGGTVVHNLVMPDIRQALIDLAREKNVVEIDIAGPLLDRLTTLLRREPAGQPDLYWQIHENHFKRITAIEFALAHDDGMRYEEWAEAEIMLLGVSRVYKTPLSLYLAMLGWKAANTPLVLEVPPRPELFELDRRRVVGLTIDPGQLLLHRQHRYRHLGVRGPSHYIDPGKVYEEVQMALKIFRRGGFAVIDVTNKPIETSAEEVLTVIKRRMERDGR